MVGFADGHNLTNNETTLSRVAFMLPQHLTPPCRPVYRVT